MSLQRTFLLAASISFTSLTTPVSVLAVIGSSSSTTEDASKDTTSCICACVGVAVVTASQRIFLEITTLMFKSGSAPAAPTYPEVSTAIVPLVLAAFVCGNSKAIGVPAASIIILKVNA